ncbi:hypothetical protein PV721_29880 [Streptomyces sp. MB09-01]|uniref:hypothetical protein n=1 Tax=Streptomyces sp. MB09-01 TaxID=3028666 RepID=UPI0029BECC60|nr:hypothetical protein [Streptomyces sp. MB09-01]MDX3538482.1 hypothetical protein [Streptomyces sp. MB09-01]
MELPVPLALAQAVPRLPHGAVGVWWYEPKFDGHRVVMERTEETVRRRRTDAAASGHRPGRRVGELEQRPARLRRRAGPGRIWFGPVARPAARLPASYAVWDVLNHPTLGDVRGRRYSPAGAGVDRKRFLQLGAGLIVAAGVTLAGRTLAIAGEQRAGSRLVDFYDCRGKPDGNYIHPYDCTKFMSCVAGQYAYERNCADCRALRTGVSPVPLGT